MTSRPRPAGCYVHVPFCARVCPYCDFAVVAGRDELIDRYFAAMLAEISMEAELGPLGSVFVGGGTPSRVRPDLLVTVIGGLRDRFGLVAAAEVTLEANPEDWSLDRAAQLAEGGFTRVSFGTQSFDDGVLAELGRMHRASELDGLVEDSRQAGFGSVSLDLIFGSPSESADSWRATVEQAIAAGPDHVSTYALTVERGTELSRQVAAGARGPDPDDQADKYLVAAELLTGAGYAHYEVSNYARPGHECLYNQNTWAQGDYIAFGLGAHGHRQGIRRRNVRRIDAYLEMVESGQRPEAGTEHIAGWDAELERAFLGIRRSAGVDAPAVAAALGDDFEAQGLLAAGKFEVEDGVIRMLDLLFTDALARVILSLPPPPSW